MDWDSSENSENSYHGRRKRIRPEAEADHQPPKTPSGMEILPREIAFDILSGLPITSLVRFKCVSRGWRALAQDPLLVTHLLSQNCDKDDPCLILHCDYPIRNHLYFSDLSVRSPEREKVRKINAPFWDLMPEFEVVGSCNGLLCLSDSLYNDALCIYNPFTGKRLELPKSVNYPDQEVVYGFGFHPKTKQYKVIKIVYYRNIGRSGSVYRSRRTIYPQSEAQVLTIDGSSTWRSLGKVPYRLFRYPTEALVINGRLHWVSRPRGNYRPSRRIISFDLADEEFREVPKPDCGGLNRCNFHLSVLRGRLSAAVYGNYGRLEIWSMKEYNAKESWVKEYNIGAYMPKGLKQSPDRPFKIYKSGRAVRVVCLLKSGEVLLEYKSRALVTYDPKLGKFKDLVLQGLPSWFHTVVHVGCLNWIDTPLDT